MKGLTGLRKMALAGLALVAGMCTVASAQEKVVDLKMCWQPEHSTYMMWIANEKGWAKEVGLKPEFVYFDSGMAQMEALPAKQWVVGGTGGVPMLVGAMRYGAYMIGIANDDSTSNAVMVRPDSPILKSKGAVAGFPETFGTADAVRGKTVLVTTVSSGHFALSTWLKRLGLTDKDVVIKNMDQGQMLAAFDSGIGDIAVLWAPGMFTGMNKGWKVVNRDSQKGANQLNVLVADKKFADENPEVVARFLKAYFKGIDHMKAEDVKLAGGFVKFLNDWAGVKISEQEASMDIAGRTIYTLEEQLKLFDASAGPSEVDKWLGNAASFFVEQGKFKKEEMDKTLKSGFVTDKFLKLAAQMK
jgi:ABC-type nitrate/sulfonate/bicarbonate transport system substrate-binding protein